MENHVPFDQRPAAVAAALVDLPYERLLAVASASLRANLDLVETINVTGGVVRRPSGTLEPEADRDWADLAEAAALASAALKDAGVALELVVTEDDES